MRSRAVRLFLLASTVVVLLGVAGAGVLAWPFLSIRQRWAREQWQARRPAHYELLVRWNDNLGLLHHVRAEIRDRRIVGATDLATGAALDTADIADDRAIFDIDLLFDAIAEQSRPAANWRSQLARYHPLLARWLDRCVERLPDVRYDAEYGYPASISYHSNPCLDTLAFRNDMRVAIEQLRVLP
jgi:hypothetical protein